MIRSLVTLSLLTALSSNALAEVDLSDMTAFDQAYGKSLSHIIGMVGPPDFVLLSGDDHELAESLITSDREIFWAVDGCSPVSVAVRGKTIVGQNFASLRVPDLMCSDEMQELLTPGPEFSCQRPDREAYCK